MGPGLNRERYRDQAQSSGPEFTRNRDQSLGPEMTGTGTRTWTSPKTLSSYQHTDIQLRNLTLSTISCQHIDIQGSILTIKTLSCQHTNI